MHFPGTVQLRESSMTALIHLCLDVRLQHWNYKLKSLKQSQDAKIDANSDAGFCNSVVSIVDGKG